MLLGSSILGKAKNAIFAVQKDRISMITLIILAIYILGVYTAYFQMPKLTDHKVANEDEYQALFTLSLFSWLIFLIYGIVYVIRKAKGEE